MPINPTWNRDEVILLYDFYFQQGYRTLSARNPDVIALGDYFRRLPWHRELWQDDAFRNPAATAMKLRQLKDYEEERKPASISLIVQAVALEFRYQPERIHELAAAIRSAVSVEPETFALLDTNEDDDGFAEGRVLEQIHRRHERNRSVVRKKIAQVLAAIGKLACEACGFDFQAAYGKRGEGFAECHHIIPLSGARERKTHPDDLAIVCANCHRMIHRASPMWTVEEVRQHLTR